MIAFGCSITEPSVYARCAGAGVALAARPGDDVLAYNASGTIQRTYNLILDDAATRDDLEAVVLLHQDAEIVAPDFAERLRRTLADPTVAVAGVVGAVGARSIGWWEGAATWPAYARSHSPGRAVPAPPPDAEEVPLGAVDIVDGFVLALSPWAVRTLRFHEIPGLLTDGFEWDVCRQARAAGRKVVAADLGVVHHHPLELVTASEAWIEAHMVAAEAWDDGAETDWRTRARRAEAEAGVARLAFVSEQMQAYARAEDFEAPLAAVMTSKSWRMTAPLRRLNERRRARAAARGAR